MYNLIKIQDELKSLPSQAIMAYANGQNPQVPPYLALAELNRRKQVQSTAAQEQGNQQGSEGMPFIRRASHDYRLLARGRRRGAQ